MPDFKHERVHCGCCGSSEYEIYARGSELKTFEFYCGLDKFELLNYVRCSQCKTIYANPRLCYDNFTLQKLDPTHVKRRENQRQNKENQQYKAQLNVERMSMIMPLLDEAPGTYCEVGCGFGDAMNVAEGAGFQVVGTEMYQEYIDYCVNNGLNVRRGDVDAIPFEEEAFSVVFLEDVMEHLKSPFQYLSECARVLKPGGVLFSHTWSIETPTTVEEGFGSNWRDDHNLDLTAHTTIFCQPALEAYASGLQLSLMELVVTRQMNHSSPATRRGSNVRFVDLFWKKQAETGKQTAS